MGDGWGLESVFKQGIFVHFDFVMQMKWINACVLLCIDEMARDNSGSLSILELPQGKLAAFLEQKPEK